MITIVALLGLATAAWGHDKGNGTLTDAKEAHGQVVDGSGGGGRDGRPCDEGSSGGPGLISTHGGGTGDATESAGGGGSG